MHCVLQFCTGCRSRMYCSVLHLSTGWKRRVHCVLQFCTGWKSRVECSVLQLRTGWKSRNKKGAPQLQAASWKRELGDRGTKDQCPTVCAFESNMLRSRRVYAYTLCSSHLCTMCVSGVHLASVAWYDMRKAQAFHIESAVQLLKAKLITKSAGSEALPIQHNGTI